MSSFFSFILPFVNKNISLVWCFHLWSFMWIYTWIIAVYRPTYLWFLLFTSFPLRQPRNSLFPTCYSWIKHILISFIVLLSDFIMPYKRVWSCNSATVQQTSASLTKQENKEIFLTAIHTTENEVSIMLPLAVWFFLQWDMGEWTLWT